MDRKKNSFRPMVEILEERALLSAGSLSLDPIVRIVSPINGGTVTQGEAVLGSGSPNGTAFALNLEVVTRDGVPVQLNEANTQPNNPGIRNVDQLGNPNPEFPGLRVYFDRDLVTPTGELITANTDLGSLFNVAGTDDTPGPGVTVWAGWHVLESIVLPPGEDDLTITAVVVDDAGRVAEDRVTVEVREGSGQGLTPAPDTFTPPVTPSYTNGPEVTMIAPRVPSSLALGTPLSQGLNSTNGSLFFIQVSALDRAGAGIALTENGEGSGSGQATGLIFDPTQIGAKGPNRSFPGLEVTFDVPLRQGNGNLVPAGQNLAPLFDIAGSEIDELTGAVRVTADWVVGGTLELPSGKTFVTITSKVTDNAGNTGVVTQVVNVSPAVSGQDLTAAPTPAAPPITVAAALDGRQERPNRVKTTAAGVGTVTLDPVARTLVVELETRNLSGDITGAHIHIVPPGQSGVKDTGPVVFDLLDLNGLTGPVANSATSFEFPSTLVTDLTDEQILAFQEGRAYFNVHTAKHPDGEIRGNLPAVEGSDGDDLLIGGTGRDRLVGNAGNDTLNGGRGDDTLVDGAGVDTLTGGQGRDRFVFNGDPFNGAVPAAPEPGQIPGVNTPDTITDFDIGQDRFVFDAQAFGVKKLKFANGVTAQLSGNANVLVLQDAFPNARAAAQAIADNPNLTAKAGFFVYFNTTLGINRLVYSQDLAGGGAFSVLANLTNQSGDAGLALLETYTADNFELIGKTDDREDRGRGRSRVADIGPDERAVAEIVHALAHSRRARIDVVDALFANAARSRLFQR